MRTFVAAVISVLVLAGCTSNAPAWWGSTGEPQYGYQSPPSRLRATQVLGARVRNDIAVSGARGADTSVALNYQARGDDALSRGELTMAAEQYGRAEEALTAASRGPVAAEAPPTRAAYHHRRHQQHRLSMAHLTKDRVARMKDRVAGEIADAKENGEDVGQARTDESEGDKALDKGDLKAAMENYQMAEKWLKTAAKSEKSEKSSGGETAAPDTNSSGSATAPAAKEEGKEAETSSSPAAAKGGDTAPPNQ